MTMQQARARTALAAEAWPCQRAGMSNPHRPILDLSAHCACGAVQVALKGKIASMFMCSCIDCQRATGTGHSSVALVPLEALSIEGEVKRFSRSADSGANFTRSFCPQCGTAIYAQSSRAPSLRMLPVGLFAGQNEWFIPNQLIFARTHQEWDLVADHLPRYQAYRPEAM